MLHWFRLVKSEMAQRRGRGGERLHIVEKKSDDGTEKEASGFNAKERRLMLFYGFLESIPLFAGGVLCWEVQGIARPVVLIAGVLGMVLVAWLLRDKVPPPRRIELAEAVGDKPGTAHRSRAAR